MKKTYEFNNATINTNSWNVLTIFPFSCSWVYDAKQFIVCDCFRIKVIIDRFPPLILVGLK